MAQLFQMHFLFTYHGAPIFLERPCDMHDMHAAAGIALTTRSWRELGSLQLTRDSTLNPNMFVTSKSA
jgi:hypothetical protein